MSAKLIAEALCTKPFIPFEVTANGLVARVNGPGLISFTTDKKCVIICEGPSFHILQLNQVESVHRLSS
jgi:hypothetical protein